ncbi:hypothetical protein Q9K01_03295 [Qipengyuania sp. DY56-A-20]|jgi:hypothetical protein|uniref:DUF1648 domain-containing protein n=1 Tax=Qipengyuania benthica TaxID=3067651 RepID=A0ABT9H5R4_9SPHN|nr:hypothetical protein [Qipengyuania sp. DY56-A-20]MBU1253436.1 hypothetical protein [Alphaproteobacteria bacterium]MBU1605872.1 hypothetical protein [Alphaproteobacteria bacterium]MDP4538648.1 hypothetical protein [Qipengyuania sp. DY56-A-20]
MAAWLPLWVAMPFVGLLLLSGLWAGRRYARFEQLPGHYDIAGNPTRMAPRRTMVWMLPMLFSLVLLTIATFTALIPREMQNGEPAIGALFGGVSLVAAQMFVLWLTERWARRQP